MNKRQTKKKDRTNYAFSFCTEKCTKYKQFKHFNRRYNVAAFPRFRTYLKEYLKNL